MDFQAVEFTFENLDYIVIPAEYFHCLRLQIDDSETKKLSKAETKERRINFELAYDANIDAEFFEGDVFSIELGIVTLFERFQIDKIIQVKVYYSETNYEAVYVICADDDFFTKSYQTVENTEDEGVRVQICWNDYRVVEK